jgi:hypothetical protein
MTERQFKSILRKAESGQFVSQLVMRALPKATESEIDEALNRVYDAIEYPEHHE